MSYLTDLLEIDMLTIRRKFEMFKDRLKEVHKDQIQTNERYIASEIFGVDPDNKEVIFFLLIGLQSIQDEIDKGGLN
jgi:hypothetical protein